ncbi:MAG: hypothetical protein WAV46_02685 [Candidatus Moraniibacteriota bacterium]
MLKNWLKGLIIGLMIMGCTLILMFASLLIIWMAGGNELSLRQLLMGVLLSWFLEVVILIPLGSLPREVNRNAFLARAIFVWLPVSGGWFLMLQGMPLWVFPAGMLISSTCVGYNMMVTHEKKKQAASRRP